MANEQFGTAFGTVTVGQSPVPMINGLTVSQYVTVRALAANAKNIFLGDINVNANTGYGRTLEPGTEVVIDTHNKNDAWFVVCSVPGNTITYATRHVEP